MKLMTTREAANRLGVGATTVKRWADEGVLACVRTRGGHRRYRYADVLAIHPTSGEPPLRQRLPSMSAQELDTLNCGVIELSNDGTILQYNATEEHFTGFRRADVLGKNFFGDVAPCTNNQIVRGRFERGVRENVLDVRLFYTFSYRLALVNVTLHLYRDPKSATNWLLIDAGQQLGKRAM